MTKCSSQLLEDFLKLHPKIIDLSLDRVVDLLDRLGNPQDRLPPTIHVAGTNGKGSTIAFLRAILDAAGFTTHGYSSPHLMKFHERIRLHEAFIHEDVLVSLLHKVAEINQHRPITFFEITSCVAFLAFSEAKADFLLLETGLGGRLDATNILKKTAASVITPISMDHQQYLGDGLADIAHEKAWIQKPDCLSIIAEQTLEAKAVLQKIADLQKARPYFYGEDWHLHLSDDGKKGDFIMKNEVCYHLSRPALQGAHQWMNLGTAVASLEAMRRAGTLNISKDQLAKAINIGAETAHWPARMQPIAFGDLAKTFPQAHITLDGGHNAAAGEALANHLANMKKDLPVFLLVGMLESKAALDFLTPLAPHIDQVFCLHIGQEASFSASQMADFAKDAGMMSIHQTDFSGYIQEIARNAPSGEFHLMIAGSLYLAGKLLTDWNYEW